MGMSFVTANAMALPDAVQQSAHAVCQLKRADSAACTATNITQDLILTAGHTLQFEDDAALMLGVYNLRVDLPLAEREVFGLEPKLPPSGFFYSLRTDIEQSIDQLGDEALMDYAICRMRRNRFGKDAGGSSRHFVAVAPPPVGAAEQEQVFLIAHQGVSRPFQSYSIGALLRVGEYFFAHTAEGATGDSGAPLFDVSGQLIGIHLADPGGYKIACRADKIMAKMNINFPGVWK